MVYLLWKRVKFTTEISITAIVLQQREAGTNQLRKMESRWNDGGSGSSTGFRQHATLRKVKLKEFENFPRH